MSATPFVGYRTNTLTICNLWRINLLRDWVNRRYQIIIVVFSIIWLTQSIIYYVYYG